MTDHKARSAAQSAYVHQDVGNESPLGLIARVYQIARLESRRAGRAITDQDWLAKGNAIQRLLRCLSVLQGSLNLEQGGEVAQNLDRIYTYLILRVTQANLNNEPLLLNEVALHLEELGTAWTQVAQNEGPPEAAAEAVAATAATP